jgi:hypothetical protein
MICQNISGIEKLISHVSGIPRAEATFKPRAHLSTEFGNSVFAFRLGAGKFSMMLNWARQSW